VQDDYRDIIDQVPADQRRSTRGRTRFSLESFLYGTFCFPLAQKAFHCEDTAAISWAKGEEISGSFGWNSISIGAKATFQTSESHTRTARPCELCRPQVCFFESTISVWRSERNAGGFRFNTLYPTFQPGSGQSLYDHNCGLCPECRDRPDPIGVMQETVPLEMSSKESRVISVVGVSQAARGSADESAMQAAVDYVESFATSLVPNEKSDLELVAVRQPRGQSVNLMAAEPGALRVALLSTDIVDETRGGREVRSGEVLPVLVAARRTASPWGRFELLRGAGGQVPIEKMETVFAQILEIGGDEFTVGWSSVELSERVWPRGSIGALRVVLGDNETDEYDAVTLAVWSEPE